MISSHLLSEMDQMATYVGIIQKGELIFQDSLDELHNKSKHHIAIKTLDNEKAFNCLTRQSIPCKVKNDSILLNQMDNNFVVHCSNLLVNERIGILRIEEQQKSLEDIFLNLTGGELAL
jgi:ABC-2 type transport system ATP-binding protein